MDAPCADNWTGADLDDRLADYLGGSAEGILELRIFRVYVCIWYSAGNYSVDVSDDSGEDSDPVDSADAALALARRLAGRVNPAGWDAFVLRQAQLSGVQPALPWFGVMA